MLIGDWISLAGMLGTIVAVIAGMRLMAQRNADSLKTVGDRVGHLETKMTNGTFATKELVDERFNSVDHRLVAIEGSLVRIESTNACSYPSCPSGFADRANRPQHGGL